MPCISGEMQKKKNIENLFRYIYSCPVVVVVVVAGMKKAEGFFPSGRELSGCVCIRAGCCALLYRRRTHRQHRERERREL
jgi:hypothetical protein